MSKSAKERRKKGGRNGETKGWRKERRGSDDKS